MLPATHASDHRLWPWGTALDIDHGLGLRLWFVRVSYKLLYYDARVIGLGSVAEVSGLGGPARE